MCCPISFFYSQTGEEDVSQFDSKFTRQTPVDSPVDSMLSESADKIFQVRKTITSWCDVSDLTNLFSFKTCFSAWSIKIIVTTS